MATFKFKGMDKYIQKLQIIGPKGSRGIIKYAVYPGAKIITDAIKAAIVSDHSESGDLAASIGLTEMRNDGGYINTKVVFAGYDRKGVPNALKAAVLESGTSDNWVPATHVISKTVRANAAAAEDAMAAALDEKISQIMED